MAGGGSIDGYREVLDEALQQHDLDKRIVGEGDEGYAEVVAGEGGCKSIGLDELVDGVADLLKHVVGCVTGDEEGVEDESQRRQGSWPIEDPFDTEELGSVDLSGYPCAPAPPAHADPPTPSRLVSAAPLCVDLSATLARPQCRGR